MAEPSSTTIAVITSTMVVIASQISGLDAAAFIGATAGASLFVMSARDLCLFTRLIYLLIAISMGYLAGPGLLNKYLAESAVSAFVVSACTISIGLRIIHLADTFDISTVITSWLNKRGGG